MTKDEFIKTYTYGLDGNELVKFDKFAALLDAMADRGNGPTQTLIADTVGLAKIGAGTGFVVIPSVKNDVDDIVHLPAVADIEIGHQVRGAINATGCEIRVAVADDTAVYLNNNNTTHNEAALAVNTSFLAVLVSKTRWILTFYSIAGAVTAPTPD